MRLNARPRRLRQRADQQRFGGAGQAGDQAMAADEEPDHDLLEHFLLADDDAADLADNLRVHLAKSGDARLQFFGLQLRRD